MFDARYSIRTHTSGGLTADEIGTHVTLAGWVAQAPRPRRSDLHRSARPLRRGAAPFRPGDRGGVRHRRAGASRVGHQGRGRRRVTGRRAQRTPTWTRARSRSRSRRCEVLNSSVTPPFEVEPGIDTDETTRMKYRYVDIRRPEVFGALKLRDAVTQRFRKALEHRGFIEVETPILTKSTPEGARDFIVPSRMQPGRLLRAAPDPRSSSSSCSWSAGIERYYQIARCFRDEDLRADRQPEFTQVDIEMSFVDQEDVLQMMEDVMHEVMKEADVDLQTPLPQAHMGRGDGPVRLGSARHAVRDGARRRLGGLRRVGVQGVLGRGLRWWGASRPSPPRVPVTGVAVASTRSNEIAVDAGAKGLAWIAFTSEGEVKSPIAKFFSDEEMAALKASLERGSLATSSMFAAARATARKRDPGRHASAHGRGARSGARRVRRALGRGLPDVRLGRGRGAVERDPPSVHTALRRAPRSARELTR